MSNQAISDAIRELGPRWFPLIANQGAMTLERDIDGKRWGAIAAGRRSGKTERVKRFVIRKGIERLCSDYPHDEQYYFFAAPTHDQAKAIFWNDLKRFLAFFDQFGTLSKSESERTITLSYPGKSDRSVQWRVIGLDKPERIEGIPWDGGAIDEFGNTKPGVFDEHIRPALDTLGKHESTFCWVFGVPEGRNHYYELAMRFKQKYDEDPAGPYGYYSWYSSEVLPAETVESAREILDPKTFAQEYEASWETKSGLVYYAYQPEFYPNGNLDNQLQYIDGLPIYCGIDFNVDPMTAILGHIRIPPDGPNAGKKELHLFKGYFLRNSNTRQLTERICADFPKCNTFYFTPCQSSMARQTVADFGVTDRRIIEQVIREHGRGCMFCARSSNPLIRDRVNATNSLMYNKRLRVRIDDAGLRELAKDFEGIAYKEGTSDHDLKDPMRGHISAALAYLVEYHFPIRRNFTEAKELVL